MSKKVEKIVMVCHCGKHYTQYMSNLTRGWGLSCSKKCAAIRRVHLLKAGEPLNPNIDIIQTKPTPNSLRMNDFRFKR